MTDLSPFEAAEIAFDKALANDRVASAQRLETILGGNGEYSAHVAFELWQQEMTTLGFAKNAHDATDESGW
jgi:hypothetical protein